VGVRVHLLVPASTSWRAAGRGGSRVAARGGSLASGAGPMVASRGIFLFFNLFNLFF
jgi:hypothetical protein